MTNERKPTSEALRIIEKVCRPSRGAELVALEIDDLSAARMATASNTDLETAAAFVDALAGVARDFQATDIGAAVGLPALARTLETWSRNIRTRKGPLWR